MSVVEQILPYERDLFLFLNNLHSPFWDSFMFLYSGKNIWIPLVVSILAVLCYKTKWRETVLLLVAVILVATLCDQISSSIIKPFFERLRPSHHPDFENYVTLVNDYKGGRFGFISSHAANGFGVATFMALIFRYRYLTLAVFSWAIINSYTRIYLGVHFISDIVGGMLLGITVGISVYYLYLYARHKLLKVDCADLKTPLYSHQRANIIIYSLLAIVLGIIIYSFFQLPA